MKVSVVIPAHNAERFIRSTLESVLAQTFGDLEVLVVDDGSSDATAEIVDSFGSPITLMAGPRLGVSAARNRGIAGARGEYVALLDHDDRWHPDKIRRQVEVLETDPIAGLVFTLAEVEEGGAVTGVFPELPDPGRFLARAYENLAHWNYIPMSSVMLRRSILAALKGPFDTSFSLAEDWDLWLRVAAGLPPGGVRFLPEPLTRYVILSGRATERMADLRLEDLAIFHRQLAERPSLATEDPERARATLHRLHLEAGYWLLKEGRRAEARRQLAAAWRRRPSSFKPLAYLAASLIPALAGARARCA